MNGEALPVLWMLPESIRDFLVCLPSQRSPAHRGSGMGFWNQGDLGPCIHATPGSHRNGKFVCECGDTAEHRNQLRKDTKATHPSAGEGLHIVSPLWLPVFGFPQWWWWEGPSFLVLTPQQIHSQRSSLSPPAQGSWPLSPLEAAAPPAGSSPGLLLFLLLFLLLLLLFFPSSSSSLFLLTLVLLKVLEALSDPQR